MVDYADPTAPDVPDATVAGGRAVGGRRRIPTAVIARRVGTGLLSLIVLLGMLQATSVAFPHGLFPSITEILRATRAVAVSDLGQIWQTILRLFIGVAFSLVFGWLLGLIMGTVPLIGEALNPIVRGLTAVPSATWIILVVLWFRGIDIRVLFIVVATLLPMYTISVYEGIRRVDGELVQAVGQFGPSRLKLIGIITLPNSVSDVMATSHVTIGLGLRILVIMELLGANSGVGFLMSQDQTGFDIAGIIALTIYMIAVTFALLGVLRVLERWLFRWRPKNALS